MTATTEQRMMWRTTVRGNPGAIYAGEAKSWVPKESSVTGRKHAWRATI